MSLVFKPSYEREGMQSQQKQCSRYKVKKIGYKNEQVGAKGSVLHTEL